MQTPSVALDIGADVGKEEEIVMACAERSFAPRKIDNRRAALLAFLKGLPARSRIGLESTGSYHELLAELAQQSPGGVCTHWKSAALSRRTPRADNSK